MSRLRAFLSSIPITLMFLFVIVAVHIVTAVWMTAESETVVLRNMGTVQLITWPSEPELRGPLDLWAGQWWRIPMGGLIHRSWIQALLTLTGFLVLGRCLEPRVSRWLYVGFLLGSLLATTQLRWSVDWVPGWFVGTSLLSGFSGVVFAQFAILIWLPDPEEKHIPRLSEDAILIGIVLGLGCLAFSLLGVLKTIDNLSHIGGAAYGFLWAMVLNRRPVLRKFGLTTLIVAHGFLVPAYQQVMSPEDSARYHWWLAKRTADEREQQHQLEITLQKDPSLDPARRELASLMLKQKHVQEAWTLLLPALDVEGEDRSPCRALAVQIWEEFRGVEHRTDAWQEFAREYPDQPEQRIQAFLLPRQASRFFPEIADWNTAWEAGLKWLGESSPTEPYEASATHVRVLWEQFETRESKHSAIETLNRIFGGERRAWQLAVVPHRDLIPYDFEVGELLWAWELVMEEIAHDPGFHFEGVLMARKIWDALPTPLRKDRARKILRDHLRPDHLRWQTRLGILPESVQQQIRPDQSVQLPIDDVPTGPAELPSPDPDHPDSASLGRSL